MKRFFAKLKKIFGNPIVPFGIAIVAFLIMFIYDYVPMYNNQGVKDAYFDMPSQLVTNGKGQYILIDNQKLIYALTEQSDGSYDVDFVIKDKNEVAYLEALLCEDGSFYVLKTDLTEEEIKIDEYDEKGKFVRNIFSETMDAGSEEYIWNASSLMEYDGKLQIVLNRLNEKTEMVTCDIKHADISHKVLPKNEAGISQYVSAAGENGELVSIFKDNSVGITFPNGDYSEYLKTDFDFWSNPDGKIINCAVPYKNGIALVFSAENKQKIYYIDQNNSKDSLIEMTELVDASSLIDKNATNQEMEEASEIHGLNNTNGYLSFTLQNKAYCLMDDGLKEISIGKNLPLNIVLFNIVLSDALQILSIFCILFGVIMGTGDLLHWRLTMVWKQLVVTGPIVVVMILVMSASFFLDYDAEYQDTATNALIEQNDLIASNVDIEKLKSMSSFSVYEDGSYDELLAFLKKQSLHKNEEWNELVSSGIYLTRDEMRGSLLVNNNSLWYQSFMETFDWTGIGKNYSDYLVNNKDHIIKQGISTTVIDTSIHQDVYLTAITPIYDEGGSQIALLISEMNKTSYWGRKVDFYNKLIYEALIFFAIFFGSTSILAYTNTRRLKAIGKSIQKISDGNFDVRINQSGKDEVGEICSGVDTMAKQLEEHFEIMKKNEKFYYKFVPEQFKDLLHKNAFTELSLGDAETVDLTVLFCDIRSFAMTSEMMTAKENFEFINVLYGIAGPIIRKYGGFVDKYIGDAVMALFESADGAVNAGMEIYKEIVLNPETAKKLRIEDINIGIGIHSGMARVGIVGEEERLSGTVISNTVNISSRLELLTKQYDTAMLITQESLDRLSNPENLNLRYLGMVQVAGVNEVRVLYEVLDCLDDGRRIPRTNNTLKFREAIRQFHTGNPERAMTLLKEFDLNDPKDPVPAKYYNYIEERLSSGDIEHKVFKFSRK